MPSESEARLKNGYINIPESDEKDGNHNRESPNRPMLRLYKHLNKTIHEGRHPEEPLQDGSQHDQADDYRVNDLFWLRFVKVYSGFR